MTQNYTKSVKYIDPPRFQGRFLQNINLVNRIKIDSMNPIYTRAKRKFSQKLYMYPSPPVFLGEMNIIPPDENVYILRMCIKTPDTNWFIPEELLWLKDFIIGCASYQKSFFPKERYYYLTVRSGEIISNNDDTFHVDGFQGSLIPRHIPEQSYLWANRDPTLFAIQPFFLEDLDPSKHNIHDYFQKHIKLDSIYSGIENGLYLFDPYHIHAKPKVQSKRRTLLRLSCLSTEIRDDSNTKNPGITFPKYNKSDPRNYFWNFPMENAEIKYGLVKK